MQFSPTLPLAAAIVSVTALLIAVLNYRRKSSVSIRGAFALSSSVDCEERYISTVTLENMKDRAVTIYGIYVAAGHNYLIEVEEFEEAPLTLRPFEIMRRAYGPIEFYGFNMRRVNMSPVLQRKGVRQRLILSTSEGRYVVRRYPRRWIPILGHFRNHAFAVVKPFRSTYKETDIGGNIRFVIDLVLSNNQNEVILLRRDDHQYQRFRNFRLTPESLTSADALREFLIERQSEGKLACKAIQVFDADEWREHVREKGWKEVVDAEHVGFFTYYVLCRILTMRSDFELRRGNKRRTRELNADPSSPRPGSDREY
jgi:hypothetical protein